MNDRETFEKMLDQQIEKGTVLLKDYQYISVEIDTGAHLNEWVRKFWNWSSYNSELIRAYFDKDIEERKYNYNELTYRLCICKNDDAEKIDYGKNNLVRQQTEDICSLERFKEQLDLLIIQVMQIDR